MSHQGYQAKWIRFPRPTKIAKKEPISKKFPRKTPVTKLQLNIVEIPLDFDRKHILGSIKISSI